MIAFNMLTSEDVAAELARRLKNRRLEENLTLEGLAKRSGVALGTLKKFEGSGRISLVSFLRLAITLKDEAALENLLREKPAEKLDDILTSAARPKRGRIT